MSEASWCGFAIKIGSPVYTIFYWLSLCVSGFFIFGYMSDFVAPDNGPSEAHLTLTTERSTMLPVCYVAIWRHFMLFFKITRRSERNMDNFEDKLSEVEERVRHAPEILKVWSQKTIIVAFSRKFGFLHYLGFRRWYYQSPHCI